MKNTQIDQTTSPITCKASVIGGHVPGHFRAILFFILLALSLPGKGQGLTSLFFDFSGVQPLSVDTTGTKGKAHMLSVNATSQIAIGVKFMEMSVNRDLHLGVILTYRQINMASLNLHDHGNQPIYEKGTLLEALLGGTYLPRKPLYQTEKTAIHITLSGYAGFQGFGFGSNLSGGLVMLSKKGLAGVTFEVVYRPLEFTYANSGSDPYYVKLQPSWSLRAALTFGKNIKYYHES